MSSRKSTAPKSKTTAYAELIADGARVFEAIGNSEHFNAYRQSPSYPDLCGVKIVIRRDDGGYWVEEGAWRLSERPSCWPAGYFLSIVDETYRAQAEARIRELGVVETIAESPEIRCQNVGRHVWVAGNAENCRRCGITWAEAHGKLGVRS